MLNGCCLGLKIHNHLVTMMVMAMTTTTVKKTITTTTAIFIGTNIHTLTHWQWDRLTRDSSLFTVHLINIKDQRKHYNSAFFQRFFSSLLFMLYICFGVLFLVYFSVVFLLLYMLLDGLYRFFSFDFISFHFFLSHL